MAGVVKLPDASFCRRFHSAASFTSSEQIAFTSKCSLYYYKVHRRMDVVCFGMLAPRKFMQKRRKLEFFKDEADEADQKNWRKMMQEIEESGTAVPVLRNRRATKEALPIDLVLGTLVRFKQLKKWNLVSEILEWLRTQHWWDFNERSVVLLITAYGKQGDFIKAERVMSYIHKKAYPPNVVSYTALMEAYGRGGQYNKAEAVFRRMQNSGPEPSAVTYQIILKTMVEGNKFDEADEIFQHLINDKKPPLNPDQKMFHLMIYMHKKAGNYEKARKTFSLMTERGIQQNTITYNSLMSFETNYKEVSKIYDQMQRAGQKPDVVSYALLIHAYGRARREEEALAVFEEMLDAGVRPTHKAYNILLDAFAISGMVEQARTVFKSMRRDRLTPDLCSYTTMLSGYVNASDMDGAEKFFRRLRQDGLQPSVVTYGTLIKGYARSNELQKMMDKYEEMKKSGIAANQVIFTTMMDAYGKSGDFGSAVLWFKEMEVCGCPPDQKAKNILLSLAKTSEEKAEAEELAGIAKVSSVANSLNPELSDGSSESDYDSEDDEYEDIDEETEESKRLVEEEINLAVIGH